MTSSGTVTDWADFDWFVGTYIPKQTVPVLRTFGQIVEHGTSTYLGLRQGDRKADVIYKLTSAFTAMKNTAQLERYARLRRQCEMQGTSLPNPYRDPPRPAPTFGGASSSASNVRYGSTSTAYRPVPSASYRPGAAAAAGGSGWGQTSNSSALYGGATRGVIMQDWKANPLWKPVKALTSLESLPDIAVGESSHAKRERKTHFVLPSDVVEKISQSKQNPAAVPQYQVRLFCTSSDHYRPPGMPVPPGGPQLDNLNLPIEYPSVPEVHVDEYPISFRDRGLRGKAGSAPPFDLDKSVKGLQLVPGRMTSVAFGHMGPTVGKKKDQAKRFYFQILLVEWTPKEALLKSLEDKTPTPASESLAMIAKQRADDDDDDIVVGTSKMGLKDPLSYMRITRPVRSIHCRHLQCFDARWWIESNNTHPQWHCPCCSKVLRFEDLIVDGFFLDILNTVNEDEEEVLLEEEGEWHTEDGKFGSASWMAKHPPALPTNPNGGAQMPTPAATESTETRRDASQLRSESPDTKGKRKAIEILSSDDEDERPLLYRAASAVGGPPSGRPLYDRLPSGSAAPSGSRPSAPPGRSPSRAPPAGGRAAVIDLTLSSDEEDDEDEDDDEEDDAYTERPPFSSRVSPRPRTPPLASNGMPSRSYSDDRLAVNGQNGQTYNPNARSKSPAATAYPGASRTNGFDISAARFDSNATTTGSAFWDDPYFRPPGSSRPGLSSAPPSSTHLTSASANANGSSNNNGQGGARITPVDDLVGFLASQSRHAYDSDETDEEPPEQTLRRKELEKALADAAAGWD